MAADVRRRLDADISIVFRMLNRSDWFVLPAHARHLPLPPVCEY